MNKFSVMDKYKFLIPANFDVDAHIRQYPTNSIPHFRKEKLLYCIHIITDIPARNKDLNDYDGYVPIYTPVLHDMIGDRYYLYLRYLVQTGVLVAKRQYSAGNSRKYRFADKYRVLNLTRYEMPVSKWLMDKLKHKKKRRLLGRGQSPVVAIEKKLPIRRADMSHTDSSEYEEMMYAKLPYAYKWYDVGGLQIDSAAANLHNRAICKYRQNGFIELEVRWNRNMRCHVAKDPIQQYQSGLVNFLDVENKDYNVKFDANVFRMYSVLTSMPKEFRPYISWKGQQLVAVDITNSQPYLLAALLSPEFWMVQEENKPLSIHSLPYSHNYIQSYPLSILIMLSNFLQANLPMDVGVYKRMVSNGKLYEYMVKHLPAKTDGTAYTRKEIKSKMFLVLFTENATIDAKWARLKRDFARLFPNVYRIIEQVQSIGCDKLPTLLQRLESYVMYYKVLPRIAMEYPELPVFTIHDSVVTLKGYEDKVKSILQDELLKATGLAATCKYEYWDKDAARYELYGQEVMYDYMVDCIRSGCDY